MANENAFSELFKASSRDFNESNYRNWLAKETGSIDIRGIGGGVGALRFPILKLYTELYVRAGLTNLEPKVGRSRGIQTKTREEMTKLSDLYKVNPQTLESRRLSLIEIVNSTRCLVIVGDPGSGKTTFLRFLANKTLSLNNEIFPCYVRLTGVDEFARNKEMSISPELLIDYLLDVSKRENLQLTKYGLERRSLSGKILWLLDGLDELPSLAVREAMVEAIEDASQIWKESRFVLTSRPLALTGKAIPVDFVIVGIDQMQDHDIRAFLETWTSLLFSEADDRSRNKYLTELYDAIRDNPTIRSLARNPVMLTCMAVVHFNEHHLPEGRADLLEAVIKWLIRARERSEDREGTLTLNPFTIEGIYRKIALAMFKTKSGPRYQIGLYQAAELVKSHFENTEKALNFLVQTEAKTGILVRRGEGDLAFWHSLFQEYLAAKEIAGKTDADWWSEVRHNLGKYEWRAVVCLVPACLIKGGNERVDLFFKKISRDVENSDLPEKAKRVGLGGCILNDLSAYGYSPRNLPAWNKILRDVTPIFSDEEMTIPLRDRFDAAVAYGIGGDPRLHSFEDTWARMSGGAFVMGAQSKDQSQDNFDSEATEWEGPPTFVEIEPFEIRKYPITVEEFERFVDDLGYDLSSKDYWSQEGWKWKCLEKVDSPKEIERQRLVPNCPITYVSWFEAEAYANWLTENSGNSVYRLPSEAQWEFAARRKNLNKRFSWGESISSGDVAQANWVGSGIGKVTPVGIFPKSNTADGMTDMIGNVEEWCADNWSWQHIDYPRNGSPRIVNGDDNRVVRGGSTIRVSRLCRPTYRSRCQQGLRYGTIGFRLVRFPSNSNKNKETIINTKQKS